MSGYGPIRLITAVRAAENVKGSYILYLFGVSLSFIILI
jgi:hypothetical protein